MSLGIPSEEELASCLLYDPVDEREFIDTMNRILPSNLHVYKAFIFPVTNMRKREGLTQNLWGGLYEIHFNDSFSAKEFFESEKGKDLLKETQSYRFLVDDISDCPQSLSALLYNSDKKFRTAVEEHFGSRWYEILTSVKKQTLATQTITGWTAEDELQWRHDNKNFEKSDPNAQNSSEPVSYFKLYERIAKINSDLINARSELTKERKEFYKKHPDVKKQHEDAKSVNKDDE